VPRYRLLVILINTVNCFYDRERNCNSRVFRVCTLTVTRLSVPPTQSLSSLHSHSRRCVSCLTINLYSSSSSFIYTSPTHWAAVWSTRITPVPLLLTGVRHHPPGRTDKHLCRCFGAPARRVFPSPVCSASCLRFVRCPPIAPNRARRRVGAAGLRRITRCPHGGCVHGCHAAARRHRRHVC
jgi:hypothetical protein